MIEEDEDALICDFAETYHIHDIEGLPVEDAATLAAGLRADSRIMMRLGGEAVKSDTLLLAHIADELRWLHWAQTKDGHDNVNLPERIAARLSGARQEIRQGFESSADFDAARDRLLKRMGKR